jgi:hypothetical protein
MWTNITLFLIFEIKIFFVSENLASAIPCFVILFGDHTGKPGLITHYN